MHDGDHRRNSEHHAQGRTDLVEICVDSCTSLSATMRDIPPLSAARESVTSFVARAGDFTVQNSVFEPLKGMLLTVCRAGVIPAGSALPDFYCDQPCAIFMLFLKGRCTMEVAGNEGLCLEMKENDFIAGDWYGQYAKGHIAAQKHWSHVSLMVTEAAVRENFGLRFAESMARILHFRRDGTRRPVPVLAGHGSPGLVSIGRRLVSMRKDNPLNAMEMRSAALDFFARMLSDAELSQRQRVAVLSEYDVRMLACLKERIEREFLERASVRDLCASVGMSESKANRAFKQLYSVTISGFINDCKLRYAHEMLGKRARNVSECALEIGYASISHFINAFRRQYGQTPGNVYRRAL